MKARDEVLLFCFPKTKDSITGQIHALPSQLISETTESEAILEMKVLRRWDQENFRFHLLTALKELQNRMAQAICLISYICS